MFADKKQLHALGVVFNNKAEILRSAARKVENAKRNQKESSARICTLSEECTFAIDRC
jgi:hypothetical protein